MAQGAWWSAACCISAVEVSKAAELEVAEPGHLEECSGGEGVSSWDDMVPATEEAPDLLGPFKTRHADSFCTISEAGTHTTAASSSDIMCRASSCLRAQSTNASLEDDASASADLQPPTATEAGRSTGPDSEPVCERKTTGSLMERVRRRSSTLFTAVRKVPAVVDAEESPAQSSEWIPSTTLPQLRAALLRTDRCLFMQFMRKAIQCKDFEDSDWKPCPAIEGNMVRKVWYNVPCPTDVPAFARRLLSIPELLCTTTNFRLQTLEGDRRIRLVQHSYTRDVLYGDRFKIESRLDCTESKGGVLLQQWEKVIWERQLPWTHGAVTSLIEKRAKDDSIASFAVFTSAVKDALKLIADEEFLCGIPEEDGP